MPISPELLEFQKRVSSKHAHVVKAALASMSPEMIKHIKAREAIDEALHFAVIGHLDDVVDLLVPMASTFYASQCLAVAVQYKNVSAVKALVHAADVSTEKYLAVRMALLIDAPEMEPIVDILFDKIDHDDLKEHMLTIKNGIGQIIWDAIQNTTAGRSYLQQVKVLQDQDALWSNVDHSSQSSPKPSKM